MLQLNFSPNFQKSSASKGKYYWDDIDFANILFQYQKVHRQPFIW